MTNTKTNTRTKEMIINDIIAYFENNENVFNDCKVEKQKHYITTIIPDDIVLSPVEQSKHYNGFIVLEV